MYGISETVVASLCNSIQNFEKLEKNQHVILKYLMYHELN
jgi:hypothetical protein